MKRGFTSYHFVALTAAVMIFGLLTGCATSGFMGFGDPLTTTSYVENALTESTQQTASELETVKSQIKELNELKAELETVLDTIEQNKKDTEALRNLAESVGERLEEMPVEMLRQLVTALQTYLDDVEASGAAGQEQ